MTKSHKNNRARITARERVRAAEDCDGVECDDCDRIVKMLGAHAAATLARYKAKQKKART